MAKKVSFIYELKENVIGKIGQMNKGFKSLGGIIGKVGKVVTNFAKVSLALLTAAIGLSIKNAIQFENSMKKVFTLLDTEGKKSFKELKDGVIELSRVIPQSAKQLSEALFDVVSAGVDAADAMKFLEAAAKLAVGGATDTKVAVDGLTSVMNAYALSVDEVTDISDVMFQAQVEGKTTIAELSQTIGRLAPISKAAGLGIEEMFAAVTTLTKGGIKTDEAVTSLRATLSAIISPSKEATDQAKKLGIEFNVGALKTKGLIGVLQDVQEATKGDVEEMSKLVPEVRALTGVLALAGAQAEDFAEIQGKLENSSGATEVAFKAQSETIQSQLVILRNEFDKFANRIVTKNAPKIVKFLKKITKVLETNEDEQIAAQKKHLDWQVKMWGERTKKGKEYLNELLTQTKAELEANKIQVNLWKGSLLEQAKINLASNTYAVKKIEDTLAAYKKAEDDKIKAKKEAIAKQKAEEEKAAVAKAMLKAQSNAGKASVKIAEDTRKKRVKEMEKEAIAGTKIWKNFMKMVVGIQQSIANAQQNRRDTAEQIEKEHTETLADIDLDHERSKEDLLAEFENKTFETNKERRDAQKDLNDKLEALEIRKNRALSDANDDMRDKEKENQGNFLTDTVNAVKEAIKKVIDTKVQQAIGELLLTAAANWWNPVGWGSAAAAFGVAAIGETAKSAVDSIKLAKGGIVSPQPGGTLATIGEAGEAEVVSPLSKLPELIEEMGLGGSGEIVIHNHTYIDSKQVAVSVTKHQKRFTRTKEF